MNILTVADVMADIRAKAGQENARRAYEVFEGIYAQRGIIQTPEEVLAAKKSFKAIDDISSKRLLGRYVLPLSAGSGKTTFMVAWCATIHRFKMDYSVAIASFQVKDCFNLREQLIAEGIPEDEIGVKHSYSVEDMAGIENACPSTDTPWKHRFLLVTHARLKDVKSRKDPLSFHGGARSIIFWDEEFRSRKGFHFNIHKLRKDISGFIRVADDLSLKGISNEELSSIKKILQRVLTCLESHLGHSDEPKALLPKLDIGADTQRETLFEAVIKREMTLLGLNMDERIITKDGKERPKYAFLTWGQQNGTNDYMYCRHMCTIGILDIGPDNIIAQAVAQTEGRYLPSRLMKPSKRTPSTFPRFLGRISATYRSSKPLRVTASNRLGSYGSVRLSAFCSMYRAHSRASDFM